MNIFKIEHAPKQEKQNGKHIKKNKQICSEYISFCLELQAVSHTHTHTHTHIQRSMFGEVKGRGGGGYLISREAICIMITLCYCEVRTYGSFNCSRDF